MAKAKTSAAVEPARERGKRPPTVKDIAALTGVSITTVSNVMLGKDGTYSPETAEKVRAAAKQLGYRRNNLARSLVRQRSQTLGLLLESRFNVSHPENQYFVGFLQGFLSEASRRNYQVKITVQPDPTRDEVVSVLDDASIDGLAAIVISPDNALLPWFEEERIPVVLVGSEARSSKVSSVDVDDYESMAELLEHAWSLGHRRYALLRGPQINDALAERERAFREHIAERRDGPVKAEVIHCDMEGAEVDAVLAALAAKPKAKRPTVLVCANDLVAVSIIRRAATHGLSVPGDFSVTGFDGFAVGEWCTPQLTTIKQPLARIGAKAVEILIDSVEGEQRRIHHAVLPGRLQLRESLQAPAGA